MEITLELIGVIVAFLGLLGGGLKAHSGLMSRLAAIEATLKQLIEDQRKEREKFQKLFDTDSDFRERISRLETKVFGNGGKH